MVTGFGALTVVVFHSILDEKDGEITWTEIQNLFFS
jgi:hypothetical protein